MGLYRLLLAIAVAMSHAGFKLYGYNPGVVAVISFFILSGYASSMLVGKYYMRPSAVPAFYLERAARLFPQFLFYMIIGSILIFFFKVDSPFILHNEFTVGKWLLNFLILPQGFFMYWGVGALVIPQTWALGLIMTFYLAIPWILIFLSKRQIYTLACMSFLIFMAAYLGIINSNVFGYRLLPGTLFMFLVGWSFHQDTRDSRKYRITVFSSAGALLLLAVFDKSFYKLGFNKEILMGLMIGIVSVSLIKRYFEFSSIDEFLGNLSYGVFLNHIIIMWMMQIFLNIKVSDIWSATILIISSCALALGSYYFIERPALKWRRAVRAGTVRSMPDPAVNLDPTR